MSERTRWPRRGAVATGSREEENAQQDLLWHLLAFFPEPYAMLFAFQDESCTHDAAVAMGVTGVLFGRDSLTTFNRRWSKELKLAGIRQFHKADSAGLRGEFKGKTHEFADQLYRKLVPIVEKCALGSVTACSIPIGEFDAIRTRRWKYSPYTIASCVCMFAAVNLAKRLGHKEVSFFIENGHENMGELRDAIKALRTVGWPGVASYSFNDKADLHALYLISVS